MRQSGTHGGRGHQRRAQRKSVDTTRRGMALSGLQSTARNESIGDATVRTRMLYGGGVKANVEVPERLQPGVLHAVTYAVNPFYIVPPTGGAQPEDRPALSLILNTIQPPPYPAFDDYKIGTVCWDDASGFFDAVPDTPGTCKTGHEGSAQAMGGARWFTKAGALPGEPGRGTVITPGLPVAIGTYAVEIPNTRYRLTVDPADMPDYVEDDQFVGYTSLVTNITFIEGKASRKIGLMLHMKRTYTNPVETFYTADPPPTEHPTIAIDTEVSYNYFYVGPGDQPLNVTDNVVDPIQGDTLKLPNHGVGFAEKLEVADIEPYGTVRVVKIDDSDEENIAITTTEMGDKGKFALGNKVYKVEFLGFRYLDQEDWEVCSGVNGHSDFMSPMEWFEASGERYPEDYDPSFHDPEPVRDTVWIWPNITSHTTAYYYLRTVNCFELMVRFTQV